MPSISLRLTPIEHRILVTVARQHGGNLTDAFRALLQKESIMEELRKEFRPLIEAQEKRTAEYEAHAEMLDKAVVRMFETETKNAETLAAIGAGLRRVVQYLDRKK